MIFRLPIVLSQSESFETDGPSDDLILTQLFMERGWDATLLGKLDQIEPGSTDALCLESINGPFVLFSRHDASAVASQLTRLSVPGRLFQPLANAQPVELSASQRSIYFFHISTHSEFERTLQSIRKIQESLAQPVFNIPPANLAGELHTNPVGQTEPIRNVLNFEQSLPSGQNAIVVHGPASVGDAGFPNSTANLAVAVLDSKDEAKLDSLIDQLDQANV